MGKAARQANRTARAAVTTAAPARLGLKGTADAIRALERQLDREVVEARAGGWTWAQIGAAVGQHRQHAHRRFRHLFLDGELPTNDTPNG